MNDHEDNTANGEAGGTSPKPLPPAPLASDGRGRLQGLPDRDQEERGTARGTGRLPVQTVEHLHRLLGGDPRLEAMVLRFIADKYGARNLLFLPPKVAVEVIRRPADFLRAVKEYCEPELGF